MTVGTFARLIGAAGLVKIIAPLPPSDTTEDPLMLVAITFAQIPCPHYMLYGLCVNLTLGIVQFPLSLVAIFAPSQIDLSSV